jgi:Flp pilus assembly protein TadD
LERARSLAPNDARTTRQLAKLFLQLHEISKAREQYEQAVRLDAKEPEPYLELAALQRAANDSAGNVQWLQRGLAACPSSAALHYQMAVALEAAGKPAEALEEYREARRIEPDNLTAYREGAVVAFKLGRDAEAVEFLEAGLKRDATSTVLRAMLTRYRNQTK